MVSLTQFKHRLALTTTLLGASLAGYARQAYAACANSGGSTYLCSGANGATQTINADDANVSTAVGFSVNTNAGNAITITGYGALSFTDTHGSAITTTYGQGWGLYVNATGDDGGTPGSITINSNSAITGGYNGIHALNNGTGMISIASYGDVIATVYGGIKAINNSNAGMAITTGLTTHTTGNYGILAVNLGTAGATSITVDGDVTGTADNGLKAQAFGIGLTITNGVNSTITGHLDGIYGFNQGAGALSVIANGSITGTNRRGIYAFNFSYATDLAITTGAGSVVSGYTKGIDARNNGTGALSITANGDVTGTTLVGIYGKNHSGATDLTITTGAGSVVSGHTKGIDARNNGTGALSITANGDVTGTTLVGIYGRNQSSATDLTITTGASSHITGHTYGISANSQGSGALSITHNGYISSAVNDGIYAVNGYYPGHVGGNMTILANAGSTVVGHRYGIKAFNYGQALSVTANGNVSGAVYSGIEAYNGTTGTSLTVSTGPGSIIAGNHYGLSAENYGTGGTSVTVNGDVTGTIFGGVRVKNAYGPSLSFTSATGTHLTGYGPGVYAKNRGTGAMSLTIGGDVTSTNRRGIYAYNKGTDLTIVAGVNTHINGYDAGIQAGNKGSGVLSITANGNVNGHIDGLVAYNYGSSLNIIANNPITGTLGNGISAKNYSTGAASITANSDINGGGNSGIALLNYSAMDLTITANAGFHISGQTDGIVADNKGSSASFITADGNVTGSDRYGIYARNYGTNLTITTGAGSIITGGSYGIEAYNNGSGITTITVSGDVTGTTAAGIYAKGTANAHITLSGAAVSGLTGIAMSATTPSQVTLNGTSSAVTLTGTGGSAVHLGDQDDTLAMSGAVTVHGDITGGAGADTLTLGAGNITLPDAGHNTISGFEAIDVSGHAVVNGNIDASGSALTIGSGGNLHVNGLFNAASLTVGSGGQFGGNNAFTGNLIVGSGGTIAPGNSIGTINVVGNVTFNSGSTFQVEVNGASSDQLNATGDITIQPGVTFEVVPIGSFSGSSTPFLTAGGTVTGTFTTVTLNGVATTIVYDPASVSFGGTLLAISPQSFNAEAQASMSASRLFEDTVAEESVNGALSRDKRFWMRALYTHDNRASEGNFNGFATTLYGIALGGEQPVSDHRKLGFALGQIEDHAALKRSLDKVQAHTSMASLYTTYTQPYGHSELFSTLGAGLGYLQGSNKRYVTNSGIPAFAKSDTDALTGNAFLQLGFKTPLTGGWSVTPKLGALYTRLGETGFTERGGGLAGVAMNGWQTASWHTQQAIDLTSDTPISLTPWQIIPTLSVGLVQEYGSHTGHRTGSFQNGTPFTLDLDRDSRNFATIGTALDFSLTQALTAQLSYHYAYNHKEIQNDARAQMSVRF